MQNYIKKNINKIITIFILLQPFIDLITGILIHNNINLTFGIIIRMLFLAFIMFIVTFVYKRKNAIYVYLSILIYSILYLIGILYFKNGVGLFYELQGLCKVIYFPILLYSLFTIKDDLDININLLFKVLVTYILLIFIPTILNIGFDTYKVTKKGSLGFFNAANEVSGIISLLIPILFIKLEDKKNILLKGIFFLIFLITILNMGTKTPLLSLIISLSVVVILVLINLIKKKRYKLLVSLFATLLVFIAAIILILPKTNFYKNIQVHLDYLGVDNIYEVFTEFNLVDHFIFSQRLTFLSDEYSLYKESNSYQKAFGRGYLYEGEETKTIEMDYFDIYFHHGYIGFILYFIIYINILIKIFKNNKKLNYRNIMLYTSLFLIIILSLFTGHIIIAPSVNMIVISIILILIN